MTKASPVPYLYACLVMLIIMVALGGATRLTGSGLSMVTWEPIIGILPPLNTQDWVALFEAYQKSPEFMLINSSMDLEGFKGIFWLEYIHRVWGRLMGIPLLLATICIFRSSDSPLKKAIIGVWILAILQGAMGWYMVKSGLNKDPHVSPYRLTAHLFLAFTTFGVLLAMVQRMRLGKWGRGSPLQLILGVSIVCTIALGGMVAGMKAGLIYNTYPLMGTYIWPEEIHASIPLFQNHGVIQFLHRVLATITLALAWGLRNRISGGNVIASIITLQYGLGILTLLYQVPVDLGVLHQLGGLFVFGAWVWYLEAPLKEAKI